jgi:hypothetical protein
MTWYSCLPEPLDVPNLPKVEPQLVVNTQIIPDGTLAVFLTRTVGALEVSEDSDIADVLDKVTVNDASVLLRGPSGTDTLLSLGTGSYGGVNIDFITGATYTLIIDSESLGHAEATTRAVPAIPFTSLEVRQYFDGFDDTLAQVKYHIQDPVEKNFYMINVQAISTRNSPIQEQLLNPDSYTRLVDDADFAGNNIEETFIVFNEEYKPGDTVFVSASNITQEYYDFIKLRLDNRLAFLEFVSEPINYPSNVTGGRGFFNLYIPDVRLMIIPEE